MPSERLDAPGIYALLRKILRAPAAQCVPPVCVSTGGGLQRQPEERDAGSDGGDNRRFAAESASFPRPQRCAGIDAESVLDKLDVVGQLT